ncbi:hypothetical protein [Parasitella parasitica]|uniref:N-acetyltransferase domain-containing protein n=1 Tax=Parasitella parasitica TaxID=35722 RepID=A0A0B7MS94_9FUNG|nr:hypothetical protein [Parasitella parasitica]
MTNYSNIKILYLAKPDQLELAYHVRHEVYVIEQGYLPNVVTDEDDADAEHWDAVADNLNMDGSIVANHSIGTVGLVRISHTVARWGRVAVWSDTRGLGIESKLINVFIDHCISNGFHTIYLHAVSEKRGFYEKLGFAVEVGDDQEFEEDGTPHIRLWMRNIKPNT